MIDLIDECSTDLQAAGYRLSRQKKYDISVGALDVCDEEKSKRLGFEMGKYYIINSPLVHQLGGECSDFTSRLLSQRLSEIIDSLSLSPLSRYLLVGVGNPDILADSLGKRTLDYVATDAFNENNNIFKLVPNIYLNTGISTNDMVTILGLALDVDCVILIDALATKNISRLGVSFQINSAGLTPGSAVNNVNKRIDKKSLGAPCISIGVPFMIFASDLMSDCTAESGGSGGYIILAPKDIHENVDLAAKIIAKALSKSLQLGAVK